MCTAQTAKRRRKQAAKKYRHLPPLKRPHYAVRSKEANARRLARLIDRQKAMQSRKAAKGS